MIVMVGGRPFIPLKCAGHYLGGYSRQWVLEYFERMPRAPKRVVISERKTGWWKSDLDNWLKRRPKKRVA